MVNMITNELRNRSRVVILDLLEYKLHERYNFVFGKEGL